MIRDVNKRTRGSVQRHCVSLTYLIYLKSKLLKERGDKGIRIEGIKIESATQSQHTHSNRQKERQKTGDEPSKKRRRNKQSD